MFLESVATGEQSHTVEWISEDLICVMYSMPCEVAGAVTDYTSANKKAWKLLKEAYPTKFFHGCLAHTLHLLVQDIFGCSKKKIGPEGGMAYPDNYPFEHLLHFALSCKNFVVYFNSHHLLKARYRKH